MSAAVPTRRIGGHKLAPYLFISPFFVLFIIFGAFPILYSGYISLHEWTGLRPPVFIGLGNYKNLLQDTDFILALRNTVVLMLISGPLTIGGGLVLAVILNNKM